MAPTRAVPDVMADAVATGVRGVIVLASGYREVGAAGRELENQLVDQAAAAGITVLGPNCLGFINATAAAPFALNVPLPLQAGPLGSRCTAAPCPASSWPSPARTASGSAR